MKIRFRCACERREKIADLFYHPSIMIIVLFITTLPSTTSLLSTDSHQLMAEELHWKVWLLFKRLPLGSALLLTQLLELPHFSSPKQLSSLYTQGTSWITSHFIKCCQGQSMLLEPELCAEGLQQREAGAPAAARQQRPEPGPWRLSRPELTGCICAPANHRDALSFSLDLLVFVVEFCCWRQQGRRVCDSRGLKNVLKGKTERNNQCRQKQESFN